MSVLIETRNLSKEFIDPLDLAAKTANIFGGNLKENRVKAVTDVNLQVHESEVVGIVGESGCGKSTLGRMISNILSPSGGQIFYRNQDIATMDKVTKRDFSTNVQMIFQNPFASLNPRMKVKSIIGEAPLCHGIVRSTGELNDYLDDVMLKTGLDPSYKDRYPHQFSGGQRQRIGIARALAVKPQCIVCDEAVASLDVSIQAQILNLFMDLRELLDLTYVFISHDLSVVEHISHRIAVMYLGQLVEIASSETVFNAPMHPYTIALLECVPLIERRNFTFSALSGELPSPLNPPSGCRFHTRCPRKKSMCAEQVPALREIAPGHFCACHFC